jgi:hypothetical protein
VAFVAVAVLVVGMIVVALGLSQPGQHSNDGTKVSYSGSEDSVKHGRDTELQTSWERFCQEAKDRARQAERSEGEPGFASFIVRPGRARKTTAFGYEAEGELVIDEGYLTFRAIYTVRMGYRNGMWRYLDGTLKKTGSYPFDGPIPGFTRAEKTILGITD